MTTTEPPASEAAPRNTRADARRNRLRVLAAAQEAFEAEGIGVSVEAIARLAGVGVGTVYRHFPTKEALFEAIVLTNLEQFREQAQSLADADDAGAALYGFLGQVMDQSETSMAIKDALNESDFDGEAAAAEAFRELEAAVGHLLERAQAAGATRSDITIDELFALIGTACRASDTLRGGDVSARRLGSVILDGLRPPAPR